MGRQQHEPLPVADAKQRAFGSLAERWIDHLPGACHAAYGDRLVSLAVFGSVARGRIHPHSDIDLLAIIRDLPRSRMSRHLEFEQVERSEATRRLVSDCERSGWMCDLSPILMTPDECERGTLLFLDMTREVIILDDRRGVLRDRLDRLRARLTELGSRRVTRGMDTWTWILKPDLKPGEIIHL